MYDCLTKVELGWKDAVKILMLLDASENVKEISCDYGIVKTVFAVNKEHFIDKSESFSV